MGFYGRRMTRPLVFIAVTFLTAAPALAAPVTIHAGRLIAVPGEAPRGPSTIVVDGGRIVSVIAGHQPGAGQVIDLRDKTVLPATTEVIAQSDLAFYSGDDVLNLPLMAVGAVGMVSVASHVCSPQMVELCDAVDRGDLVEGRTRSARTG